MSDEKMSLADKLRAKKEAEGDADKPISLADRLRAQKAEKEAAGKATKSMTLADKLRAKKDDEAKAGKPMSLADKLKAQHGDDDDDDGNELPEEEAATLQSAIDDASSKFKELIRKVKLTSLAENITTLGNETRNLPSDIKAIRDRGYAYRSYLEYKVEVLEEQWQDVDEDLKQWVETESQASQLPHNVTWHGLNLQSKSSKKKLVPPKNILKANTMPSSAK